VRWKAAVLVHDHATATEAAPGRKREAVGGLFLRLLREVDQVGVIMREMEWIT